MGTNMYFGGKPVNDCLSDKMMDLELGTSGAAGEGPQMYLALNGERVLLTERAAREFCQAASNVARYFAFKID
ncbi:MAG: hypothetical protein KBF30_01390 [Hyphomonadaceae bacterium]|nr:hypothetical protein [Hyphomonadaceae bacterium]